MQSLAEEQLYQEAKTINLAVHSLVVLQAILEGDATGVS